MPLPPYFVFHRSLLESELQSSDDSTRILELPRSNHIHSLYVKAECTNGGTSAKQSDISNVIDEVKVFGSASDVLVSLTPQELKRWHIWRTGHNIVQHRDERASIVQMAVYPIQFGRYPLDQEYWLPMKNLDDPKIHIKFSPTIAATAFATGTVRLSVWALMSMGQQPGQYRGTLSTKTIKSFTSVASGEEEVKVTKGNMIRQAMVYVYEAGVAPSANITRVKFSCNDDERVLYDLPFDQLQEWNSYDNWLNISESLFAQTLDTDVVQFKMSDIEAITYGPQLTPDRTGDTVYFRTFGTPAGDQTTIIGDQGDWTGAAFDVLADSTNRPIMVSSRHTRLPNAVVLDFTKAGEGNLLNTKDYDKIAMFLTQGNAGADVRISTEEVRML